MPKVTFGLSQSQDRKFIRGSFEERIRFVETVASETKGRVSILDALIQGKRSVDWQGRRTGAPGWRTLTAAPPLSRLRSAASAISAAASPSAAVAWSDGRWLRTESMKTWSDSNHPWSRMKLGSIWQRASARAE